MKTEDGLKIVSKLSVKLTTPEAKERWRLIKEASKEIDSWDELRKAEAFNRIKV